MKGALNGTTKSMRPTAVDIQAALARLPVLQNRRPDTSEAEAGAAFAKLADSEHGEIYTGRFVGESPWERHRNGDELVQVLAGETSLTILMPAGPTTLSMNAGMLVVVPRGCWHKFQAPKGVTVLTMTPTPTDHSSEAIPPG